MGYIIGIHNVDELGEALNKVKNFTPKEYVQNTGNIVSIVEKFIDEN